MKLYAATAGRRTRQVIADVVVLLGRPEQLALAEQRLLHA